MKWTAIILAAIVCGCHCYTEREMQEAVQKAKEQTIRDARIGWNCLTCGRNLSYWYNCGGGGDWDVRDTEQEIDGYVLECRKRINEANKRLDEKLRKRAEKEGSKYEGKWSYAPREFTDAEKTRAIKFREEVR